MRTSAAHGMARYSSNAFTAGIDPDTQRMAQETVKEYFAIWRP
jgi:hypothetical protein